MNLNENNNSFFVSTNLQKLASLSFLNVGNKPV